MNKKVLLALLLSFIGLTTVAQTLPHFSDANKEAWYYVVFTTNNTVLQDVGANKEARNRNAEEDEAGQLWKLEGNKDALVLVSKTGHRLHFNKSQNRFFSLADGGTALKLVAAGGKWELHVVDASLAPAANPDATAMVMNGGDGVDKYIDLWKHDFKGCAILFVSESDMPFDMQAAPTTPQEVKVTASSKAPEEPLTLWYGRPATNWVREALPIGNGDMGAMIMGGVAQDRIQFNHKTLWKGTSNPVDLGSYLPFGDLYVTNLNAKEAKDYQRSLNIHTAEAKVSYTSDGVSYEREYLCSYPHRVMALRYKASKGHPLSLDFKLINAQGKRAAYTQEGATFSGQLSNKLNYQAQMRVLPKGGKVTASKASIRVEGAEEVTVFLTCNTDFDPKVEGHMTGDVEGMGSDLNEVLLTAKEAGFDKIKEAHMADYQALFDRVDFSLMGASNNSPTNQLLSKNVLAAKKMVDILVFQYGRYLTIAGSRGIDVPTNLQGIWNKDGYHEGDAVWASDIHANVNVEMNYWPAESTNLSECHLPFLNHIYNEAMRKGGQWQKNAQALGISKGWVVNTANNIFGGSSEYKKGTYNVANAWYCTHLWQHFAYTQDVDFLRETAMPVMKSACEFWMKRLVPAKNGDGLLECPMEYSPEQGRVQNAPAHSQQLVTQLFEETLKGIEVLGNEAAQCDEAFVSLLKQKLDKLDKGLRIDSKGLLREWKYQENTPNIGADQNHFANDEQNVWQCHRHTSHLMALYPGFNIDRNIDNDIFNAAIKSLKDRGDVATGWARAWRISLWARARDHAHAYTTLRGFAHRTTSTQYDWHGGLYDNMLDAHATTVFQIEGNYGATAGVAEMLLQSRPDSLVLLPALPKEWYAGSIKGLKAIGNFEVSMEWSQGKLNVLNILSVKGRPISLAYPGMEHCTVVDEKFGETVKFSKGTNLASFPTTEGHSYRITMPDASTGILTPEGNEGGLKVVDGRLVMDGDCSNLSLYDIQGRKHQVDEKINSGLYIVVNGANRQKVMVK